MADHLIVISRRRAGRRRDCRAQAGVDRHPPVLFDCRTQSGRHLARALDRHGICRGRTGCGEFHRLFVRQHRLDETERRAKLDRRHGDGLAGKRHGQCVEQRSGLDIGIECQLEALHHHRAVGPGAEAAERARAHAHQRTNFSIDHRIARAAEPAIDEPVIQRAAQLPQGCNQVFRNRQIERTRRTILCGSVPTTGRRQRCGGAEHRQDHSAGQQPMRWHHVGSSSKCVAPDSCPLRPFGHCR